jgi:hypothetical protein
MAFPIMLRWPRRTAADEKIIAALAPQQVLGEEEVPEAVTRGLWPGVRSGPARTGESDVVSASREPWVDANGYLAAYARALHPERPAVLAHAHKDAERAVPFDSLELALVEARVHGANFVLSVEPRYRAALEKGDAAAWAAWRSLAVTAKWLGEHEALFAAPARAGLTAVVEPGMATSEIANLLHRRGGAPLLVSVAALPRADAARCFVLVAAGLKAVPAAVYAHAAAGTVVVTDGGAAAPAGSRVVKEEADRVTYGYGRGQVVAYRKRVLDPSEFALDVIDLVGYRRRTARLWNASSAIPHFTEAGALCVVQYGGPLKEEVQARVWGHYGRARLLRPGMAAVDLKVGKRGGMTEVFPVGIRRLGVVVFEG